MTPLARKLAALIREGGPMTVAEYMAACLGDPEHGYYVSRNPFGRDGDFITAPEVSQMFGEILGAWTIATWEAMGRPAHFVLAELGPGRGTLMADILRSAKIRPAFLDAAAVHLVETSPRLRETQGATLAQSGIAVAWHNHVATLPLGPIIVIANEFFDALPVRQFVRTWRGWAERMVGLGDDGGLAWGLRELGESEQYPPQASLSPAAQSKRSYLPRKGGEGDSTDPGNEEPHENAGLEIRKGSIIETSPAAAAIMQALAERVVRQGGAALIIDYGYEGPAFGDTLQAVRRHRFDDPLANPGEADLTAHVDFAMIAAAADAAGATARPLMTQGDFLTRLGLEVRAARLAAGKDDATEAGVQAAVARLAAPDAMGTLFKVLAISSPGLALPLFDDDPAG